MQDIDQQYIDLIRRVFANGERFTDRTGTGTIATFGERLVYSADQSEFPLMQHKRMFWRGIVAELKWFLSGSTNIRSLQDQGVYFWDDWADENGDLGPTYGHQLRWRDVDQFDGLIAGIRTNPHSRRHIMSTWNSDDTDKMRLPPCHGLVTQFHVRADGKTLDMSTYQRSADIGLGLPFNVASYALLLNVVALLTDCKPGMVTYNIGNAHIYVNHKSQMLQVVASGLEQVERLGYPSIDVSIGPGYAWDVSIRGELATNVLKMEVSV